MESRWRLVVLSAALALAAVGLISSGLRPRPRTTELTYWDGAAADEPGYAEEAANQVDSGTYAAHVGFFERPGYWNNRAVADQGESEMDARMFSDASDRKNWETAGTDFMDTDSLYSESQDDMDDIMGSEYANSWPGTGANFYGWQDIAGDSDGYDFSKPQHMYTIYMYVYVYKYQCTLLCIYADISAFLDSQRHTRTHEQMHLYVSHTYKHICMYI